MATVDGITVARAQEIEDNTVVSAAIVNGQLIFTTGDGTTINAGAVVSPTQLTAHIDDANGHGITTHMNDTSTHGITSAIVGTTETQTISNKTLVTPTIASFLNAQHNHSTTATGGTINLSSQGITGRSQLHFGAKFDTAAAGGRLVIAHGAGFTPDQVFAVAGDANAQVQNNSGLVCNVLTDEIGATNFSVRVYRNSNDTGYDSSPLWIMYICVKV